MTGTLTLKKYLAYWTFGAIITAAVFLGCLMIGSDATGPVFGWPIPEFLPYRFTRVACAALVGAALSASGVSLQAMLRNPLADPYILGISSGAAVGMMVWQMIGNAVVAALLAPGWLDWLVTNGGVAFAVLGAVCTCLIVYAVARYRAAGPIDPITLLLTGVVVAACNGAILMTLNNMANQTVIVNMNSYLMGTLNDGAGNWQLGIAGGIFIAGWLLAIFLAGRMNVASLSNVEAASLGVRLGRLRALCFLAASLMTAAALTLAGPIGFVGLICPHLCRLIFGPDQRQLVITGAFFGAIFLMTADAFVNAMVTPFHGVLPVGVITALVGGPFFLVLLRRTNARALA